LISCKSKEEKQFDAKIDSLHRVTDTLNDKADSIRRDTKQFGSRVDSLFDSARVLQEKADRVHKAGDSERARMWLDSADAMNAKARAIINQR
jgi:ABC-type transporter Mla subunit MlaD